MTSTTARGGITIGEPVDGLHPESALDEIIARGDYAHNLRTRIAGARIREVLAGRGVARVDILAEGPTSFYIDSVTLADGHQETVGPLVSWVGNSLHAAGVHTFDEVDIVADSPDGDIATITTGPGAGPDAGDLSAELAAFFRFPGVVAGA